MLVKRVLGAAVGRALDATEGAGATATLAGANSKASTDEGCGISVAGCETRFARPNLEAGFFMKKWESSSKVTIRIMHIICIMAYHVLKEYCACSAYDMHYTHSTYYALMCCSISVVKAS